MSSGVLRSTHKNASCLTQQVVKVIRHKAASLPHTDGPGCANVHPCLIHGSFGQPESTTQTVSRSVQSKSVKLHIIGRPNHILVISRRNAFITFRPNIGCDRNTPLFFVYGSVIDEFADRWNPISKPNSALMCYIELSYGHFVRFLPILAKMWLTWQHSLYPCNQKYLLWIGWP